MRDKFIAALIKDSILMRNLWIICVLILSHFSSSGQNNVNEILKGKPDGSYVDRYMNDNIAFKYIIKNGNIHGEKTSYYRDGSLLNVEQFHNGKYHGSIITFNKKGDTTDVEIYKNDTLLKLTQLRFYGNDKLKFRSETNYTNDSTLKSFPFGAIYRKRNPNPVSKTTNHKTFESSYHRNGCLKNTGYYSNNMAEGYCTVHYKSGIIEIDFMFVDGQLNGKSKEYYESGAIESTSIYKDDELNGIVTYYNEDGTINSTQIFINGKKVK
ncbi:MAG: antitoxin component YwqK of YwqJK toxin-antitoxin module [Crocinitomicaceae bacterium]|jgi:antitoxin component YwqK of YwqJK toxin-antitoxin module